MGLIDRLTKRVAKTASITVTDSVKAEIKTVTRSALPTLLGIGFAIAGAVIFKSSLTKTPAAASKILPTLCTTSTVINNWFFDESVKGEILNKVLANKL